MHAYVCKINFAVHILWYVLIQRFREIGSHRGRIHVVSYQRSAGKTAVYFRYRSVSRFVGYIRNSRELRLECSAYYCVSIQSGGRLRRRDSSRPSWNPRERECTIANGWKNVRGLSFLPLGEIYPFPSSAFFPLLSSYRVFLLLFRYIFVASIAVVAVAAFSLRSA